MSTSLPTRLLRSGVAACGAAALALTLAACSDTGGSGATGTAGRATNLNFGYAGAPPPGFDPHSGATGAFQTIFPAYDTLLHVASDGSLKPWLATEWTSPDATTLEFKLRNDVKFTDGTAFDAAAVKSNIEYARDIKTGTATQAELKNIKDVEVVDPSTVRLTLAQGDPGLAAAFAQTSGEMVSPKALAAPESLVSAPAGSGPYVVDTAKTRQGTTLAWKRNPNYWAASQNAFPFDTIVYTFAQDPTAIRNAAQAGTVDLISLLPGDPVPAGFDSIKSTSGDNSGFTGIWIDTTGANVAALKDVRVRQAMNYAIDSKTIADTVYEGAAIPVSAVPITKDSPAYTPGLDNLYPHDTAKAKQLLADAGVANGLSIKLLALPIAEAFAQAIAGNLRDVGIEAKITSVAGPDLPKQLFSGTYDTGLVLQRLTGQPSTDLGGLFSPNAFFNVHHGDNKVITDGLAAAAAETDPAKQTAAYQEVTKYAADQAWFAGTMILQQITGFKKDVVSVTPPPFGEIFLYHYGAAK